QRQRGEGDRWPARREPCRQVSHQDDRGDETGEVAKERRERDVEAELPGQTEQEGPEEIRVALHPLALVVDQPETTGEVARVSKRDESVVGEPEDPPGEIQPEADGGRHQGAMQDASRTEQPSFAYPEPERRRSPRDPDRPGAQQCPGRLGDDLPGHRPTSRRAPSDAKG